MTLPFSVQTPQWANYVPLTVNYTKRVGGQYFGLGRNNAHCRASFHLATHMDGEKHFHAAGSTIGETPFKKWFGPGVVADISHYVSDTSVYTPEMVEKVVQVKEGDILVIKTGYLKYGWNSPDSDEFRYMIRHPGPSPDFADWCLKMKIKWLAVDCVAMEHPMNTIQRIWHPKTFEEANQKLIEQYGAGWDEIYPLDKYYQDMHLNLFPKGIIHAENLGGDLAQMESGRYLYWLFYPKGHGAGILLGPICGFQGAVLKDLIMILVTGAAGKTGRAVTRALARTGAAVRALIHKESQRDLVLKAGAGEVVLGDLLNPDSVIQALAGVRTLYHIPPNIHPKELEIGELVISAAKGANLDHLVYHSVLHPQIEAMPHHWLKLQGGAAFTGIRTGVYDPAACSLYAEYPPGCAGCDPEGHLSRCPIQ